jgi:hypothetical protein
MLTWVPQGSHVLSDEYSWIRLLHFENWFGKKMLLTLMMNETVCKKNDIDIFN